MKTAILDNGHGADTPGKRSPAGMLAEEGFHALYEYEFNRDIVCRMKPLLDDRGIPFVDLVTESFDVSLHERCMRANEIYRDNPEAFLISIHANAGGGTGWECFTYRGQSESDVIAEIFCKEAEQAFPEFRMRFDRTDGDLDKESGFYILKHTKCPAVLTENFFMDTERDLAFIISDEGRQRIAQMHVDAIEKYVKL